MTPLNMTAQLGIRFKVNRVHKCVGTFYILFVGFAFSFAWKELSGCWSGDRGLGIVCRCWEIMPFVAIHGQEVPTCA